jgi:hypothetical protein
MNPTKLFLNVVFSFFSIMAIAQPDPIGGFNKHVIEKWSHEYIRVSQYRVKGSPYLLGEPFDGSIEMKSGIKTEGKKILYNVFEQKVGVEMEKELVAPDGEVKAFQIQLPDKFGGEKMNFINADNLAKSPVKGYLNVFMDGPNAALYRQYRNRLVADPSEMYSKEIRMFEQYYDYFLHNKKSGVIEKVRLREKDFVSVLQGLKLPANADYASVTGIKAVLEAVNQ